LGLGFLPNNIERADDFAIEASPLAQELLALLRSEPGAGELCPICGSTCEEQRGDRFRHVWCPTPGHYDSWRASPGHKPGESPLFDEWRGMEKKI
jgi:hypothetical protein